ncbi:MAG: DNA mismatch repair endonuclease MutL [Synechococcales cyanobacterium]
MPLPVTPLAEATVRWMAAGEVVDSVTGVVRELVENALDAQATRITIEVWRSQWRVRVTDNGHGIPEADLAQVALPHTTNKLTSLALPPIVETLGFRGQALNALAHAGSLRLASRIATAAHGWEATYTPLGSLAQQRPLAQAIGTIVEVNHLWQDWPQRRVTGGQRGSLERLVQGAALTHPHVHWTVWIDGRLVLQLGGITQILDVVLQIYPRLHREDCRVGAASGWQVVIAAPERYHRPRPDGCWVGLNGRIVTVPEVMAVVQRQFQRTLPPRRYPLCVAVGQIDPAQVDWNRHPAKTEVYVDGWESHQETLHQILGELLATPMPTVPPQLLTVFQPHLRENAPHYGRTLPESVDKPSLRVLGQLDHTYIVATNGADLWLIEQHVAHERLLFEAFQQHWHLAEVGDPLIVGSLNAMAQERLQELGCEPEPFGVDQWCVRRIPQCLQDRPKPEQIEILHTVAACPDWEQVLVTLACRTAIRNGTALSLTAMHTLVQDWQQTAHPHTCPHGRPVALRVSDRDLRRFFGRRYNVCQSGLGDRLVDDIRRR